MEIEADRRSRDAAHEMHIRHSVGIACAVALHELRRVTCACLEVGALSATRAARFLRVSLYAQPGIGLERTVAVAIL